MRCAPAKKKSTPIGFAFFPAIRQTQGPFHKIDMKKILLTMFCLGLATPLLAQDTNVLADENARVSYAIGMMNGASWKSQDLGFDPDVYMRGLKDGLAGGATLLTKEQAQQAISTFRQEFMMKQQQKQKELAIKNKAIDDAFMTTNKLVPGVKTLSVTLPNGQTSEMQYLVITNGSGPTPSASDTVSVNYRGTLLDGTEFDSSYKRGQPAKFPLNGVIKGWTEALKMMSIGSKWKLFIPPDLAYGESGRPGIPPNSVLIFEVELLSIEVTPPPPSPAAPLTSDIIKVPSADELKKGAKVETIRQEDVPKYMQQQTNR